MPRVSTKKKSTRGQYRCGRCGEEIKPGEQYFSWSFRYGGPQRRCSKHPPKGSELTQSKLSQVYAAIESAEEDLPGTTTGEEIEEIVHNVASEVEQVADEYHEAAENFGEAGENQERGDELEGWAQELESWEPSDEIELEAECQECEGTGEIEVEGYEVFAGDDDEVFFEDQADANKYAAEIADTKETEGWTLTESTTAEDEVHSWIFEAKGLDGEEDGDQLIIEVRNGTESKTCEQCEGEGKLPMDEDELNEALEAARNEAIEVLGTCPL